MKIYAEMNLEEFGPWSGAIDTFETLKSLNENVDFDVFETLESLIEDISDRWDEESLNDFFWFEDETIAEWLGYKNFEELEKVANGEDIVEVEIEFEVGDIVKYKEDISSSYKAEIIEIDYEDNDFPYYVKYNVGDSIEFDWTGAEYVSAWTELDELDENENE